MEKVNQTIKQSWRQLNFFESYPISHKNEILKQTNSITAITNSNETLILAHNQGQITILNKSFQSIRSWVAFPLGRISLLKITSIKGILISIGDEPDSSFPILKIWNLTIEDKRTSAPQLIGHSIIQIGPLPHPVTTIAVTSTLHYLSLGLADGTVLLYRNLHQTLLQTNRKSNTIPKPRLIYNSKEPITGLGFTTKTNKETIYLFIITTDKVLTYNLIGNKSLPLLIDRIQNNLNNNVIDFRNQLLIIGNENGIYIYDTEGRQACLAYDGSKTQMDFFNYYLIMIENFNKLVIFDLDNRLIVYSYNCSDMIKFVWFDVNELFILTEKGEIIKLIELNLSNKLTIMFEKDLYNLSINVSKREGTSEDEIRLIYQKFGDHLYIKGDFEQAVEQYIKTIGTIQPSVIVRKFLDAQRIPNLTSYLQELHSRGVANADHTTLLLNCYTKLKDEDRLESFIKASTASEELMFELETAIRVCRQAGYSVHALGLAKRYKQHADALRIMIEDRQEWLEALNYIRSLGPLAAEENLLRYGKPLLANVAEETTKLMIDVCCGNKLIKDENEIETNRIPSLRQFFAFFIDQPEWFIIFLENVAKLRWSEVLEEEEEEEERPSPWIKVDNEVLKTNQIGNEDDEITRADKEAVWGTLLELYLQSNKFKKAIKLLNDGNLGKYCEPNQALIVCLAHDFNEGIILLYSRLNMLEEVLRIWLNLTETYEDEDNLKLALESIKSGIKLILEYKDLDLIKIGLKFFIQSKKRLENYKDELLKLLESNILKPIEVIEIMSNEKSVCCLGDLKDYLIKQVTSEQMEIEADRILMESYRKECDQKKKRINELTSDQVIQTSRCGICLNTLDSIIIHFMCQHSFHQRCLGENVKECIICKASHELIRKVQRRESSLVESKGFIEEVGVAEDSFNYIAGAFAKGLL
ncbi:hypothetical protein CROQUDRAFT_662915 [Cronartium quercuum f. sp. fusiforme G11]|uniref:E3 ubiquitin-protein ligase PEP5 n=1 Tax=Cronartium quercuum f. sp. fusiforme G11 TaxID=708437 RepID=A0A9P6T946_9BASI|nr:hypothetical protein CROQUDRAFT_662915 [Cronartium quercuum f. sp. fusiforme G11]